jgi:hypothetical protein
MLSNVAASKFPFVPGKYILILFQNAPQLSLHPFVQMLVNSDLLTNFAPPCVLLGVLHDALLYTTTRISDLHLLKLQ